MSWDDAWVAQVEAREQAMDRRICGARTIGGKPCPLSSDHPSGRCRHHGGFPLTGAPPNNRNAIIHGLYSRRLAIAGAHNPGWSSSPMGGGAPDEGKAAAKLADADRAICPFEQAEYNAVLTDLMQRTCARPENAFGLHLAHQVALLTVMVSRASRALATKPFTEKVEQVGDGYYMGVEKPSAALIAFERLSAELRRWVQLVEKNYPILKPNPATEHDCALRRQCDTDSDPDKLAALDHASGASAEKAARDAAREKANAEALKQRQHEEFFQRFGVMPGPDAYDQIKAKVKDGEYPQNGRAITPTAAPATKAPYSLQASHTRRNQSEVQQDPSTGRSEPFR